MLIKESFEIFVALGWPYGLGICCIYIVQYIIHTVLQESVFGDHAIFGVHYKGSQCVVASPVAGTERSLFISYM